MKDGHGRYAAIDWSRLSTTNGRLIRSSLQIPSGNYVDMHRESRGTPQPYEGPPVTNPDTQGPLAAA